LSAGWFEQKLAAPELRSRLRGVGLERPLNLLGCFAAGADSLRRFAGDAPLSTDHHPVVLFAAPRFAIRRDVPPHELLQTFLDRCRVQRTELPSVLPAGAEEALATNLADFITARDLYLKGLVEEGAGRLPIAIDAFLESARRSLHFTAGYARCVTIIQMLSGTDREQARQLARRLDEAQPSQPLTRQMFGPLLDEAPARP
jgi:spermidine synthase